jgi:hypothetical protein
MEKNIIAIGSRSHLWGLTGWAENANIIWLFWRIRVIQYE